MYYTKLGDDLNTITYYCRNCGNNEDDTPVGKDDIKIASIRQSDSYTVNRYTKCDPTLPRSLKMSCPNQECSTGGDATTSGKSNIVFIRHNDVDMKYTYMCCDCDTSWNMDV